MIEDVFLFIPICYICIVLLLGLLCNNGASIVSTLTLNIISEVELQCTQGSVFHTIAYSILLIRDPTWNWKQHRALPLSPLLIRFQIYAYRWVLFSCSINIATQLYCKNRKKKRSNFSINSNTFACKNKSLSRYLFQRFSALFFINVFISNNELWKIMIVNILRKCISYKF